MTNGIAAETNGIPLTPCPFCGGEPSKQFGFNVSANLKGRIICSCGAEIRQGRNDTEEQVIEAWNTRAERTCTNSSYRLDESRFHCSACGFGCWVKDVSDGRDKLPTFCPSCGAKVVGR